MNVAIKPIETVVKFKY